MLAPGAAAGQADPGGNPDAPLTRPPAGKLYGFAGISQTGDPDHATAAAYIANTQGNASRTAIHWQGIEPTRDRYRTAALDRYGDLYDALRARGIRPIFMVQFAPVWARDPGPPQDCGAYDACHYPPSRAMLGEWKEFVAELVRRFPQAAIEVWNEPNYAGQWQSGVDPERYAELLAAARDAAEAVHPGTMVLSGGLGTAPKPNSLSAGEFLRRAYAATPSLKGNTDAINFHVYPGADGLGAGSSFAAAFAEVRAARAAAGDTATPLLVSETGATTTGPNALNQDQQGQLLLETTRKILTMPDTLGALIYTLSDRTELPVSDPERGFGVLHASSGLLGSKVDVKLSYCTLRRAVLIPDLDCPPETEIRTSPPPLGESRDVTISFKSSDAGVLGFDCSLDGAIFRRCTSPMRLRGLEYGPHSFSVRARDSLNRVDPYPARTGFGIVPPTALELAAVVRPHRSKLKAGGKRKRFAVTVGAPGTPVPVRGAQVCLKAGKRLVRGRLPRCKQLATIAPGAQVGASFPVGLTRRAAGRKVGLSFAVQAPQADDVVTEATVRGRRGGKRKGHRRRR